MDRLRRAGYSPLAPQVVRERPENGRVRRTAGRLLPGYVFFDAADAPPWEEIRAFPSVLRVLQYDDGERALRASDLEFVAWLRKYGGVIEVTQVVRVGTKIAFVSGPLKEIDGKVVKVNKNRKLVQVALGGGDSLMRTVWCSIEYIDENAVTDGLQRV